MTTSFKLTIRKLWKNRLFTGLNILGLAIGISACWIVFRIVNYEFSFDRSHPYKEHIYQVVSKQFFENKEGTFGGVPLPLAPFIRSTHPDIAVVVPVYNRYYETVSIPAHNNKPQIYEEQSAIKSVLPAYFKLVPYTWLAGNPSAALAEPNQVVLTASRATLYFPKTTYTDIVGKTVQYDSTLFTVTGVVADLDQPSSFDGKEFMPIPTNEWTNENWMGSNSNHTLFIKLKDPQKASLLQSANKKITDMVGEKFKEYNVRIWFDVLPLAEKHFRQDVAMGSYAANPKILYGLIGIGFFLLLLACINYINLTTAQIPQRAKEIGIRKTMGERSWRMTWNFLQETFMICMLGLLLSIPLVRAFQWMFTDFMPPQINEYSDLRAVIIFLIVLVTTLTLIAGLYPSYLINRVNVVQVIKLKSIGKLTLGNITLRKILIVFQFVIAQVFVIGTFIIARQMTFMMEKDLGFDKQAVITMRFPYKSSENADVNPFLLKQALSNDKDIQAVALGHLPMSSEHWGNNLSIETDTGKVQVHLPFKYVDPEFFNVYDIQHLAGRAPTLADTARGIFLNEQARKALGFQSNEQAVGQFVNYSENTPLQIVGILQDFHQKDLHTGMEPLGIRISTQQHTLRAFNIKLSKNTETWPATITRIEKAWKVFYPNAPFLYKFYDDEIRAMYESDVRQARMINLATAVTVILSCLGLIGLVTLTAYQRTKEIGIRKVLGSTIPGIVILLAKDYVKLVGIAIVLACPIAWWGMNKWLENFAYRIDVQWWMLLSTGLITVVIALLSVSYQAVKAARFNPVDSLRDE
ncbi:ABC transporter permease [Sphingobacterium suaedae]|uniref:ABC transporter permease n=1 Tax=Sphingobacterium suaedae TaxID=1686402 RepID=A0ABW5KGV5_9SPHI